MVFLNYDYRLNIRSIASNKEIFIISSLAVAFSLFAGEYTVYACIAIIIIMLGYIFGEKFILSVIIISLFTLVGDFNKELRTYIQLVDFGLLVILFLRRFGFQTSFYPRIPKILIYFVALYYVSMITSLIMSDYPFAGVENILRQSIFFIIAYLFFALIKDESYIRIYFVAFVFATVVLALSTIHSFVLEGSSLIELNLGLRSRVSGLISNPNMLTNFYMISIPILIISLLFYKYSVNRSIILFLLFLFFAGLILTISRTALLGILISTLIIFYMFRKKYFYSSISVILTLLLILVLYEPFGNVASLLLRLERGLTGREFIWDISASIIKDNPVFGIGVGAFKLEMFNYFPIMFDSWVGQELIKLHEITGAGSNLSHNFFLGFYTDMGILGLLTAVTFAIIYFRIGIKTINIYKRKTSKDYYFIVALFLGGATMFARALVDNVGVISHGTIK